MQKFMEENITGRKQERKAGIISSTLLMTEPKENIHGLSMFLMQQRTEAITTL